MSLPRLSVYAGILVVLFLQAFAVKAGEDAPYPWLDPKTRVLPTGDLEWKPEPFVFEKRDSVGYIDYEGGNDANSGTQQQPWQHHPWDPAASGKAAEAHGVDTFVFKRGVMYRGEIVVRESGKPGHPLRFTSDPAWGQGEATIVGSEHVTGWNRGVDNPLIPEPEKVWSVDLDFAPRNVWMILDKSDGQVVRIPLARTPNWQASDPDDVKSEWFHFNNPDRRDTFGAKYEDGKKAYLGNIWQSIGYMLFRHADPQKLTADPNARDAQVASSAFEHASNAYVSNMFYDLPKTLVGVFEDTGRTFDSLDALRQAMAAQGTIGDLGELAQQSLLRDPAQHDFRPTVLAREKGVRVFVPWSLYATVGEWHFYHFGNDPTLIPDEHFYLASYYVGRESYYQNPTYPLRTKNMDAKNFVVGPLEDWTQGALNFNGKDQYAVMAEKTVKADSKKTAAKRKKKTAEPSSAVIDYDSPSVDRSNFLLEAYFRTEPGHTGGVLIEKMNTIGYSLRVDSHGGVTFHVVGKSESGKVQSQAKINDGKWHHVIAESDRTAKTLRLYVDGLRDAEAIGVDAAVSLRNQADLYVGGHPDGHCLVGTIDFMRVALGTLEDSKTTIEELYAWQFNGPFLQDFVGRPMKDKRTAGALEYTQD